VQVLWKEPGSLHLSARAALDLKEDTMSHTPGPWTIQPVSVGFRAPHPDAEDKMILGSNKVCPGITWGFGEEGEANARLIEAAPDMLVGLEDAAAFLENVSDDLLGHHPGECCCHRCNLVRLIAKVKGRNG
jgi:hypothetical protein